MTGILIKVISAKDMFSRNPRLGETCQSSVFTLPMTTPFVLVPRPEGLSEEEYAAQRDIYGPKARRKYHLNNPYRWYRQEHMPDPTTQPDLYRRELKLKHQEQLTLISLVYAEEFRDCCPCWKDGPCSQCS